MSDQNRQFDEYLKSKLHDLDRATPPPDWDLMEQKLEQFYAYRRSVIKLKLMEAGLVLLLLLTIVQYSGYISGSNSGGNPDINHLEVAAIPEKQNADHNQTAIADRIFTTLLQIENAESRFGIVQTSGPSPATAGVSSEMLPINNVVQATGNKRASIPGASGLDPQERLNTQHAQKATIVVAEEHEEVVSSFGIALFAENAEVQSIAENDNVEMQAQHKDAVNSSVSVIAEAVSKAATDAVLSREKQSLFALVEPRVESATGITAAESAFISPEMLPLLAFFANANTVTEEPENVLSKINLRTLIPGQQVTAPRSYFLMVDAGAARLKNFSRTVNHHRYSQSSTNPTMSIGAGMSLSDYWHAWLRVKNVTGAFMPNSDFDYIVGSDPHGNYSLLFDSAGVNMTSISLHLFPKLADNERIAWYFMMGASANGITHATYNRRTYSLKPGEDDNGPTPGKDMRDVGLLEGGNIGTNLFVSLDFGTLISYRFAPNVSVFINPIILYPLKGIGAGQDMILVTQWSLGTIYHLR